MCQAQRTATHSTVLLTASDSSQLFFPLFFRSVQNQLETCFTAAERAQLLRWLINRQQTGFNGRPNKDTDTCYSFWVGGTLALLGAEHVIDRRALRGFLLSNEDLLTGGFRKSQGAHPDPLHTYMSLAGLSLQREPGLAELDPCASTVNERKRQGKTGESERKVVLSSAKGKP